jgi:hypothetical protein
VKKARKTRFGADAKCMTMLLHLTTVLKGLEEGSFKTGVEAAVVEAGAYLDSR